MAIALQSPLSKISGKSKNERFRAFTSREIYHHLKFLELVKSTPFIMTDTFAGIYSANTGINIPIRFDEPGERESLMNDMSKRFKEHFYLCIGSQLEQICSQLGCVENMSIVVPTKFFNYVAHSSGLMNSPYYLSESDTKAHLIQMKQLLDLNAPLGEAIGYRSRSQQAVCRMSTEMVTRSYWNLMESIQGEEYFNHIGYNFGRRDSLRDFIALMENPMKRQMICDLVSIIVILNGNKDIPFTLRILSMLKLRYDREISTIMDEDYDYIRSLSYLDPCSALCVDFKYKEYWCRHRADRERLMPINDLVVHYLASCYNLYGRHYDREIEEDCCCEMG